MTTRTTDPSVDDDSATGPDDPPSKTKRKQAMLELQALGKRLVELPASQLAGAPIPEDLREAIVEKHRIAHSKHEAQRRQLQYIGRLMRDIETAPIRDWLARIDGQSADATRELHQAERWRDRLIADDAALTDFARAHPAVDLQALRAVIRETRRDRAATERGEARPPKHFRELFRIIRDARAAGAGAAGKVEDEEQDEGEGDES